MAVAYKKFTGELSASILKWADPAGTMVKSPTRVRTLGGGMVGLALGSSVCCCVCRSVCMYEADGSMIGWIGGRSIGFGATH